MHKCHKNVVICVRKLVVTDCCLVSINVATGLSLVNTRLLHFSTSDNIKFYATVPYQVNVSINKFSKARLPWLNPKRSEILPLNGEIDYNLRIMLVSNQRRELLV